MAANTPKGTPGIETIEFFLLPHDQQLSTISALTTSPYPKDLPNDVAQRFLTYVQSMALRAVAAKHDALINEGVAEKFTAVPHPSDEGLGVEYSYRGTSELLNILTSDGSVAGFYRRAITSRARKHKESSSDLRLAETIRAEGGSPDFDRISRRGPKNYHHLEPTDRQRELIHYPRKDLTFDEIFQFEQFALVSLQIERLARLSGHDVRVNSISSLSESIDHLVAEFGVGDAVVDFHRQPLSAGGHEYTLSNRVNVGRSQCKPFVIPSPSASPRGDGVLGEIVGSAVTKLGRISAVSRALPSRGL